MRQITLALLIAAVPAYADPDWAIRPEPGLICMSPQPGTVIFELASVKSKQIAIAGRIVLVRQQRKPVDGFVEIERANRQLGWVEQSALSPGPDGCVPTLMSNGLIYAGENQ